MTIPSDKAKAMTPLNTLKISHPTIIKISFNHNHPIDSAHALSFRPVALHAKEAYYQLFKTGHSAATARHTYETRIMLENDEDVMHVLSDRAVNPNPQDVSRLFAEWRSHNLGPENGIEMFDKLDALIHEYNLQHSKDGGKIVLQKYSTDAYHSEVQSDGDQSGDDHKPPCKKRRKES